jgi:hypothetical protein
MTSINADKIMSWFIEHEDGQFVRPPRTRPFHIVGPKSSLQPILYTTKPQCLLTPKDSETEYATGLIGRYGLPQEDDVAWLQTFIGDRAVFFVGDADPVDLLVFVWLRSRINVKYAGVNDLLLATIGLSWNDRVTIPMSESEAAAMVLLAEVCSDFRLLLGPQCAGLLDRGQKLELEALTVYPGMDARNLLKAITEVP